MSRLAGLATYLPRRGSGAAYLLATLLVGASVLLREGWPPEIKQHFFPFFHVFPAVAAASFAGGFRVGLYASVVSGAIVWRFWLNPAGSWELTPKTATALTGASAALAIELAIGATARLLLDQVLRLHASRELAARESAHRIKNLLMIVSALARRSGAHGDYEAFLEDFTGRIRSLAAANDVLLSQRFAPANIAVVVRAALEPFTVDERLRIAGGPSFDVPAELVLGLSLALYELATNSLKYGALCAPDGRALVVWASDGETCRIEWLEEQVRVASIVDGVGAAVIRGAMNGYRGAAVHYERSLEKVSCSFQWPCVSRETKTAFLRIDARR